MSNNGGLVTLGRDNPTRASSEAVGHTGRFANDGNPATFWQATDGDQNRWLALDLERIVAVTRVKLIFPSEGEWGYNVEISNDGLTDWKKIGDEKANPGLAKEKTLNATSGASGRFLRVTITSTPAGQSPAVAELEVTGTLKTQ